jgi:hypothetical protein
MLSLYALAITVFSVLPISAASFFNYNASRGSSDSPSGVCRMVQGIGGDLPATQRHS